MKIIVSRYGKLEKLRRHFGTERKPKWDKWFIITPFIDFLSVKLVVQEHLFYLKKFEDKRWKKLFCFDLPDNTFQF